MNTIYTAGYLAGWTPANLKARADELGATIVDVRYAPGSRIAGWNKWELERLLGAGYRWCRDYGNPNYNRPGPMTLSDPERAAHQLAALLAGQPLILLCGCAVAQECHRHLAAEDLSTRTGAPVEHLFPDTGAKPGHIKVVTLWEPYATLIALRLKEWETRDAWVTWLGHPLPLRLAIHAAKTKEGFRDALPRIMVQALAERGYRKVDDFPRGKIVAVADWTRCLPTEVVAAKGISDMERACGGWARGRRALRMENVRRLTQPLEVERGYQGLWQHELAPIEALVEPI